MAILSCCSRFVLRETPPQEIEEETLSQVPVLGGIEGIADRAYERGPFPDTPSEDLLRLQMLAAAQVRPSSVTCRSASSTSASPRTWAASTSGNRSSTWNVARAPVWEDPRVHRGQRGSPGGRPCHPRSPAAAGCRPATPPPGRPRPDVGPEQGVTTGHQTVDLVHQGSEAIIVPVAGLGEPAGYFRADATRIGTEHEDTVGQDHRFLDVVGHDQHRLRREVLLPPQPEEPPPAGCAVSTSRAEKGSSIKRASGSPRPGESHPLPHPARQLLRVGGLETVEADGVDGPLGPLPPLTALDPERLQPEFDVLEHRQPGQKGEALKDHGYAGVGTVERVTPVLDFAGGRCDQSGDATQQCALP